MRFCSAASKPPPDHLSGKPKMPNRKNSSVAAITMTFQPKFLFINNDFRLPISNGQLHPKQTGNGPLKIENHEIYFAVSSGVVTDATEPLLTSIRKLSGGTRKCR